MNVETITARISCTIPTQQFGNIAFYLEAIATLNPDDDPAACTTRLLTTTRAALIAEIRSTMDVFDERVSTWLAVADTHHPPAPVAITPPVSAPPGAPVKEQPYVR